LRRAVLPLGEGWGEGLLLDDDYLGLEDATVLLAGQSRLCV